MGVDSVLYDNCILFIELCTSSIFFLFFVASLSFQKEGEHVRMKQNVFLFCLHPMVLENYLILGSSLYST